MLDDIKMYKKTILRGFLQLKRPEYLIYAPFETIYHTVRCGFELTFRLEDKTRLNYPDQNI